jgi:hypothetical protein
MFRNFLLIVFAVAISFNVAAAVKLNFAKIYPALVAGVVTCSMFGCQNADHRFEDYNSSFIHVTTIPFKSVP